VCPKIAIPTWENVDRPEDLGFLFFFKKNTSDRSDRTHARKKMLKRSQEPVMFKKNTYLDGSYQTLGDRLLLLYSPYQYDGIGFHFSASLRTG